MYSFTRPNGLKPGPLREKNFLLSLTLVTVAFLGAVHVWTRSFYQGPNFDRAFDALVHISMADSLVSGGGFTSLPGSYSSLWTPFYPITVAFIRLFGIDLVDAGLLVNAAAFGLVILWTGIWLYRYIGSQLLALGGAVTVMTSYTLTWLSSNVLSEPLFICLTLLALAQLERFMRSDDYRQSAIIWSAVCAALAAITKYMGITVILTAVILIFIGVRLPLSRKLKYAAIYCSISLVPLTIWMTHNWLITGYLTGDRSFSRSRTITLADMLSQIVDVFYFWTFPKDTPFNRWLELLLVVAVGFIAVGMIRQVRNPNPGKLNPVKILGLALPFALFIVVYLIVFMITFPFASWSTVDERYMSPIYVPTVGVLAVLFYRLYKSTIWGEKWTAVKWVFILLIGIGYLGSISRAIWLNLDETTDRIDERMASIGGYTRNSETIDYLIRKPIDGQIYSNKSSTLYGMALLYDVPELKGSINTREDTELSGCLSWIQEIKESDDRPYLVHFREKITSKFCNPAELESQSNDLELVIRTFDGVVYRVVARP